MERFSKKLRTMPRFLLPFSHLFLLLLPLVTFLSRFNCASLFPPPPPSHFLHIHPLVERDEQIFARIRDDRS